MDGWVGGDGLSPPQGSPAAGRYAVTVASANHGGNRIARRLAEHRIDVRDLNRCLGENVRGETIRCSMGQRERDGAGVLGFGLDEKFASESVRRGR